VSAAARTSLSGPTDQSQEPFKSAQDELEVLQTWFVDRGISMPWPTAPTLNVPNISRNQWDGASADRVATALAARYPERAVNRR
jgi:hypothetical protein